MKVVLVIARGALLLLGQIMTRDKGAKRSHPIWENLWKNNLKEKDLSVAVNLPIIRNPSPKKRSKKSKKRHRSKSKKNKGKGIGDIHVCHHHQARLMTILMRVNIEIMNARKTQIPDLEFLRWISANTAYLQIWSNTATLILMLKSKRQT